MKILPAIDIKDGQAVRLLKGDFSQKTVVNPDVLEQARVFKEAGVTMIHVVDLDGALEGRAANRDLIAQIKAETGLAIQVGGGIRTVEDMKRMLQAGADKVAVNSSALANPQLLADCAEKFGRQCVVLAVDAKKEADGSWHVYLAGGRKDSGRDLLDWVQEAVSLGAGEILLTSMDKDGTKSGFDLPMLEAVSQVVSVPIIASGGAGSSQHILEVFEKTAATGALAASIFHYGQVSIAETKKAMREAGLEVRL